MTFGKLIALSVLLSFAINVFAACEDPPQRGVDWQLCDKSAADLSGADLTYANLWGANLAGADLSSATLLEADLRNADLSTVLLDGANLQRSVITGATFANSDLSDANFLEAVGSPAAFSTTLSDTTCPDGYKTPQASGSCDEHFLEERWVRILDWSVREDEGLARLLVTLVRENPTGEICVGFEDQEPLSSATRDKDYAMTRGELCWTANGDATIDVPIYDDDEIEPTETVVIGLLAADLPFGFVTVRGGLGKVTIEDNDFLTTHPAVPVDSNWTLILLTLSMMILGGLMIRRNY